MAKGRRSPAERDLLRREEATRLLVAGQTGPALSRAWAGVQAELAKVWQDRPDDAVALHRAVVTLLLAVAANLYRYNTAYGSLAAALVEADYERGPETLNRTRPPERVWVR